MATLRKRRQERKQADTLAMRLLESSLLQTQFVNEGVAATQNTSSTTNNGAKPSTSGPNYFPSNKTTELDYYSDLRQIIKK